MERQGSVFAIAEKPAEVSPDWLGYRFIAPSRHARSGKLSPLHIEKLPNSLVMGVEEAHEVEFLLDSPYDFAMAGYAEMPTPKDKSASLLTTVGQQLLGRTIMAGQQAVLQNLASDEESRLGITQAADKAWERLVDSNVRLVSAIAKRVRRDMPFRDAQQQGYLGLMQAARKFDYRKGFRFSTYADPWIKQFIAVGRAESSFQISVKPKDAIKLDELQDVTSLLVENDIAPTNSTLAEVIGCEVPEVWERMHMREMTSHQISLNSHARGDRELIDTLPDESTYSVSGDREKTEEVDTLLFAAINALPETHRDMYIQNQAHEVYSSGIGKSKARDVTLLAKEQGLPISIVEAMLDEAKFMLVHPSSGLISEVDPREDREGFYDAECVNEPYEVFFTATADQPEARAVRAQMCGSCAMQGACEKLAVEYEATAGYFGNVNFGAKDSPGSLDLQATS